MRKLTARKLFNLFTYGFEIEGAFDYHLRDGLITLANQKKYNVDFKGDSSVGIMRRIDDINADEINFGVFNSFSEMIKCLYLFRNGDNYIENQSCGLHIHIKPKRGWGKKLKTLIFDSQFIDKIQKWAMHNLCDRIKNRVRINENQYCAKYNTNDLNGLAWSLRRHDKYRFFRNHTIGTIEFRFFSPCVHKEKNVIKFFKFFFMELAKQKREKSFDDKITMKTKPTKKNMDIVLPVELVFKKNVNHVCAL
jgi:hypothetical protein